MDYWPNVDAVGWFARDVLPALRLSWPGLRFWIVGANPAAEVTGLAERPGVQVTGVQVTGRVADTRPYIARADVVVAPLRIARGIQNKVLEAMAMGRPVVASPQAFEGVHALAGRDLLVADGAAATASRIAEVLQGRHPGLGAAGRQAVERGHAWAATLAGLDALMEGDNSR
jgi:glycosyltransferase involved in cell wall biosynthesis